MRFKVSTTYANFSEKLTFRNVNFCKNFGHTYKMYDSQHDLYEFLVLFDNFESFDFSRKTYEEKKCARSNLFNLFTQIFCQIIMMNISSNFLMNGPFKIRSSNSQNI